MAVVLLASPGYSEAFRCVSKTPYTSIKKTCEVKYKSADRLQIFGLYPDNQVLTVDLRRNNTYSLQNEYWSEGVPTGSIVSNTKGSYFKDGSDLVLTNEFGLIKISPLRD